MNARAQSNRTAPHASDSWTIPSFADFDWNLMGFGLCRAWITMLFSLSLPAFLASSTSTRLWILLPGAAFCLLLLPAPKRILSRQIRTLSLVLSGIFAVLGLIGVYTGITNCVAALAIIALALLSISGALMQVLWGEKVALLPEKAIDFYTISAFLVAALLGTLIQFVADETARWVCLAILPLSSLILLYRGFSAGTWEYTIPTKSVDHATHQRDSQNSSPANRLPFGRFCISIFIFVVIFNAISPIFSIVENPLPARTTANLVVTLGLFLLLLLRGSINLTSLYPLSFIVLLGSTLAMLFVPQDFLFVPMFFAAAGYKLFDILFWCLLITMAHYLDNKKWRILGLGMAANFGGMGLGNALGDFTAVLRNTPTADDTFIICAFAFVLAITIVIVLPERLLAQLTPHRQTKPTELDRLSIEATHDTLTSDTRNATDHVTTQSLEVHCEEVAIQHQLTRREREVLLLLAQGRTQSVIAKKLGISEGTVHTHILHVYQKLNVHSQQELIELIS